MSNPARTTALAFAALGLVLTPACETVRTVTHVESISSSQSDPLSKRFVGQSIDRWEDGERHSMDHQRVDTKDLFGGSRDNSQFGGNQAEKKRFAGNKRFRGNKQYEPNQYQFIRDREVARKEALAASETFGDRNKVAGEAKRGWFGRDRKFGSKSANEAGENYATDTLRETEGIARQHDETPLPIVDPPGRDGSGLSLSDLREMLGRGEGTETIHVPPTFR